MKIFNFMKRITPICVIKILFAALLFTTPLLLINQVKSNQIYLETTKRWSESGDSSHVSIFFEDKAEVNDKNIFELRYKLQNKMAEEKVKTKKENTRLFADCYYSENDIKISKGENSISVKAYGVGGDFFLFHPFEIISGDYFYSDNPMKDLVVIDEELAWKIFGAVEVDGMNMIIGGKEYKIAGVIKHDNSKLSKASTENQYIIYMYYEAFADNSNIVGYEIVMPNLTKNYAYNHIKNILNEILENKDSTGKYEIIEVTNRYSFINLCKIIKNFANRVMVTSNIEYPYWENNARAIEEICGFILFIFIIELFVGIIFMVIKIMNWNSIRKDKKIDTVILDIGKVLVDFIPREYFRKLGFDEKTVDILMDAVVENDIWNEFDRGIMTEKEVLTKFIDNNKKYETEIRKAFSNLNGIVKKYDYTEKWISDLKSKGFRVLYLSNLSEKLYKECIDELNFTERMDGGILSFEDKMKKPEKEIYEHIIKKCNLIPEKCIFIDDREENLVEAENIGINTILFTNYEDVCKKIKKM